MLKFKASDIVLSARLPFSRSQTKQIGRLLAQHIVATRSRTLGASEKKQMGHDEDRLLHQKWMHTDDKKKTVEMFLNENQLTVNDFARFECGGAEI